MLIQIFCFISSYKVLVSKIGFSKSSNLISSQRSFRTLSDFKSLLTIYSIPMGYSMPILLYVLTIHLLHNGQTTYEAAGVNIAAGNELIRNLKDRIESTFGDGGISPIGSFGAVLDLRLKSDYTDPALVSGCDGVGTKLKIAQELQNHESIGQDLVAMCVNDILAHGAKPLFFLDYFSCGKLENDIAEAVISSIIDGCKLAECALVGGETAEMPGFYKEGEYDLAGFTVGVVEKHLMLPKIISPNDKVIYLPSSGLHSNGFSLIRKIIKDRLIDLRSIAPFSNENLTYGQEFLKPTKIYTKEILPLAKNQSIKAFAHITGGGLLENVGRVLPNDLKVDLDATLWNISPVFGWVAVSGSIGEEQMLRTFNCGIGGIVIVDPEKANEVAEFLNSNVIGTVVPKESDDEPQVSIRNFVKELTKTMEPFIPLYTNPEYTIYKRVAVLISGVGSNLRALIESTISDPYSPAKIVLVISSRALVGGLDIADEFGIRSRVIERKRGVSRDTNDQPIVEELKKEKIDIVCLAGYMHILGDAFVRQFHGRMLNIHPSLLPAFKGLRPQHQALEAGVTVSGCTVHFVEPEVDSGAIIEQGIVPIYPQDTEEELATRIKEREHEIYPRALKMLAAGKITLDQNTGKVIRN